jgi:AcrR family transcriptional regulator
MQSAKHRIITAAMRMFAERGYQSTAVADLLRESSVHSGSLYYAFPTKQDVLIAVLEAYRDGIVPMLLEPAWKGVHDPIERIFALLGAYRKLLVDTDCTYGCPIGSLALELHEPDPPVRTLLAANFEGWIDHVRDCLEAARDRFPEDIDTRRLGTFLLTVMEGGVMQARTQRDIKAFDDCVSVLRDYFDRLIEASDKGGKK